MDGVNLLGGQSREHLICETFGCYKREFQHRMLRWGNYKYIAHENDFDEFYNLKTDPFELHNLIHETEYCRQLEEAKARMLDTAKQYGDSFTVT
ncbi:arylsulfatase [Enterocloster clostridioformis]|jgi:arylsulfatase A-like enzyme|uniref:Arylsulfatase n=2 Tax=Enterocloster clostridioformis TaxID=1531 RepID=A0A2X2TY27_9FIRM|nr:arylsulfatase [Enterocloster clostridioformis]